MSDMHKKEQDQKLESEKAARKAMHLRTDKRLANIIVELCKRENNKYN